MISAQQKAIFIICLVWVLDKKNFITMYIYNLWIYIQNGGWCRACPVGEVLVKIIYEEKIGCDKTELLEQLRSTILDTLWLKHCHHTDEHKKLSLLELWKDLLRGHASEYPRFCQFVQFNDCYITQHIKSWEGLLKESVKVYQHYHVIVVYIISFPFRPS